MNPGAKYLADPIKRGLLRARALDSPSLDEVIRVIANEVMDQPGVVVKALAESGYQPDHMVKVVEGGMGWIVQHSLTCRISGNMYKCLIHEAMIIYSQTNTPEVGTYVATLDKECNIRLRKV